MVIIIIWTFDFIACSDAARMTCSTWYRFSYDMYIVLIQTFACLGAKNTAFYKLQATASPLTPIHSRVWGNYTYNNSVHIVAIYIRSLCSLLLIFIHILYLQVLLEKIFITPRYAQNQATFISTVASFSNTSIYFGTGSITTTLLEVPVIPAGRYTRNSFITIQITAAIDGAMFNTRRDRDVQFGVTDDSTENAFWIADVNNYPTSRTPCQFISASETVARPLTTGPAPDQFTFLFKPVERFGACSTAQQGGYVNVGIFNDQLDPSRGIKLQIKRNERDEDYRFYYFLVEIFQ